MVLVLIRHIQLVAIALIFSNDDFCYCKERREINSVSNTVSKTENSKYALRGNRNLWFTVSNPLTNQFPETNIQLPSFQIPETNQANEFFNNVADTVNALLGGNQDGNTGSGSASDFVTIITEIFDRSSGTDETIASNANDAVEDATQFVNQIVGGGNDMNNQAMMVFDTIEAEIRKSCSDILDFLDTQVIEVANQVNNGAVVPLNTLTSIVPLPEEVQKQVDAVTDIVGPNLGEIPALGGVVSLNDITDLVKIGIINLRELCKAAEPAMELPGLPIELPEPPITIISAP